MFFVKVSKILASIMFDEFQLEFAYSSRRKPEEIEQAKRNGDEHLPRLTDQTIKRESRLHCHFKINFNNFVQTVHFVWIVIHLCF